MTPATGISLTVAQGTKTRASLASQELASLGLTGLCDTCTPHLVKESNRKVIYASRPDQLMFRVSIFMHVGLELEIHTVEPCGSDEWQIGLYEE